MQSLLAKRGGDDERDPFNYPFEAFKLARYARFSFALGDNDLREGINRLASFVYS